MKTTSGKGKILNTCIYKSSEELPKSWDKFLPDGHALQSNQLALYETIQLPDIATYYACYGDTEKPSAIAYFQVLSLKGKHINKIFLSSVQRVLVSGLLSMFRPKLLVAGHLFRHEMPTFYTIHLTNLEAFRAYDAMIQVLVNETCAMAALIKDAPEYLVDYFQNFAPHYSILRNDISMEMSLPDIWESFTDYEASLKHKYAQKLRKVRTGIKPLHIKELSEEEVKNESVNIYRLYKQVSEKQSVRLGLLNEAFIPTLKSFYKEKLKIWGFYEADKMIAFASAWLHETAFDMFYIGFDYERNSELQLYFNILYLSIEQGIVARKDKLILGRTALEAKARLGCTPHYLHTYLYINNRYLRQLVNTQMTKQYQQEGAWEERHPMKTNV
jgi:hypothetical protein